MKKPFKPYKKKGFEIKVERVDLKKWMVRSTSGFDWLIIGTDLQFCLDKTIEAIIKQYYVHN